ncbi:MAG: hypothetical protein HC868_14000 [Sphingomonadales bacterium]|nr:hypothetical protein [Sphingomonadales bacterium]
MANILDTSDVPVVPATDLALAMRFMIDNGRGLVLMRRLSNADMQELEEALWDRIEGDTAHRRAVLMRFQYLVDVFGARRLREQLLQRGFRLIAPALQLAAEMRLNAKWGFSPHKFNAALRSLVLELDQARETAAEPAFDLAA